MSSSSYDELVQKISDLRSQMNAGFQQVNGKLQQVNGKLDTVLDTLAPQNSDLFAKAVFVLPSTADGVTEHREATWTCLRCSKDPKFAYCAVSSAHVGLNNYSRTKNVGFVALPSFF